MRHTRANPLIAIKNDSRSMSDYQVAALIPALQRQVTEHFQPVWGIGAQIIFAEKKVPRDAYQVVVYEEATDADDQGFLGYHFSPQGYPIASVFAREDMKEDGTISDTLSHEILEMLVDPAVNLYAHRPAGRGRRARGYFYEVCDAVQCQHYKIDGVVVTDFVYPEWYEYIWPKGSRKFDHLGLLDEPFQVLSDCYADIYEERYTTETGEQKGGFRTIWGSVQRKRRGRHRLKERLRKRNLL
jgi:hypothetical protein